MCHCLQGLTDTEADLSSLGSRPASRQVSCDISRDTAELPDFKPSSSFKSKMKSHDSGIFEKVNSCLLQINLKYVKGATFTAVVMEDESMLKNKGYGL